MANEKTPLAGSQKNAGASACPNIQETIANEKIPLAGSQNAGASACPMASDGGLDPAAVPLPVAILLPLAFFVWGNITWIRCRSNMTDGEEQIYQGIFMCLFAYPLGLAIPHAKLKRAMSLCHGVSLLQGTKLVACGLAWHSAFGFTDGTPVSVWAKWINLYGMWGNTFGTIWNAVTGATDLLYITKDTVSYRAPRWAENVQHIILKSQGLCNMIAMVMILQQMAATCGI
jgi:hypothetical protein